MRYYLGQCEYKWTHANTDMENRWIRLELGDDLYRTVEENNWEWRLLRSSSTSLPGDVYCRRDRYVDVDNNRQGTLFSLKYSDAICIGDK